MPNKKVEEAIKEILANAPKIKGYKPKDLGRIVGYWPEQPRWHLERCEAPRNTNEKIGSSKLYLDVKTNSV